MAVLKKDESKGDKPNLKNFLGEIEKRAYEVYLERMKAGKSGDEMNDWLQAEKDVKAKFKI
jgi:hypothetical protein